MGNQNCGKTTLFNQLTGANQHVGNFPGVTVDRKDGAIRGHAEATVTDLPGVYSLSPYSNEEIVTRDFLLDEKPDGIINIVDGTNIERNLYLTMQIMELGIPMVLALNMMDEVEANGGTVRVNELEAELGIPVVPISAAKNEGVDELVDHALHVARFDEAPGRIDFCPASAQEHDPLGAAHRCIHATAHIIEPYAEQASVPARFAATKMVEGDELIARKLDLPESAVSSVRELTAAMEADAGMDAEAALANMRFAFLANLCDNTVVRPHESREHKRSVSVDKLLTGRYTGIPCFFAIMAAVFVLTFSVVGAALSDLVSTGVDAALEALAAGCEAWGLNSVAQSLLVDGIGAGVGAVIGFLPTIVTLFFFLSILEDSGYMARVAFVMDRPMRKIGLSGRSIVPLLMGFGDWRAATALMTGFMAKESVVSTLTQVMGEGVELTMLFTPVTAMAFLAFVLLYTPCVAAIATVRSEQGGARAALEMVLLQCGIAWVVSFAVYLAGSLVTGGIADAFSLPGLVAAGVIAVGIGVYLKRQRTDGELRVGCKTCPANCKNSSGCCH